MTRPNKKHDSKFITIIGCENCLDQGKIISGTYRHRDRQTTFGFTSPHSDHEAIFSRDEWRLATSEDK